LKQQSALTQRTPLTRVAYTNIPVAYLYCEEDKVLPVAVQQMMVQESGLDVLELRCSASHSPFLSQPENFVRHVISTIPS
jgi:hypothetical protein